MFPKECSRWHKYTDKQTHIATHRFFLVIYNRSWFRAVFQSTASFVKYINFHILCITKSFDTKTVFHRRKTESHGAVTSLPAPVVKLEFLNHAC